MTSPVDPMELEEEIVPYKLERTAQRTAKKFRGSSQRYNLTFNSTWLSRQQPEDLPVLLREQFDAVLVDLRDDVGGHDGDRVGVAIEHPALDSNIRIPFQPLGDLQGENILAEVEKVQQSNQDLNIDETMDIYFLHVEDPALLGKGHGRLKGSVGLNAFLEKKQCIVQIKNKDQLCFARALVVASHHAHQPDPVTKEWTKEWKYIRDSRKPAQLKYAQALFRQLKIPEGPCTGQATWELFSQRLGPYYQLKIYSQKVMNRLLYKSEVSHPKKILHLYHHDDHYDVITSMPAFSGYSYYCEACDQGYSDAQNHPCTREFRCHWCQGPGSCGDVKNEGLSCLQCGGWFRNSHCFQRHLTASSDKQPSTCSTIHTCHRCMAKVNVRKIKGMANHVCGKDQECKRCKEPLGPNHKCYITPIEPPTQDDEGMSEAKERQLRQFIFYDFECTQDQGTHVPNLCVVHLGCGKCISEASDQLCEQCPWRKEGEGPSRVKVFQGPTTLKDMGDWLMSLAEKKKVPKKKRKAQQQSGNTSKHICQDHSYGKTAEAQEEEVDEEGEEEEGDTTIDDAEVLVIAHNYRAYDGHLLLQYFHQHLVKAPQVTLRGLHILQMTVGRLVFKDSLNFILMALKKFPKTFGLTELKKGYFPHFFNTEANQGYVGPYPPVATYDPDGMFPEERAAFLAWYKARVAEGAVFDLDEELLAYCQSDVDILRRGCAAFRHLFIQQNNVDPFYEAVTLPMACMLTFRKLFLDPRTIAIIPPQGYRPQRRYSLQCLHWLSWMMHEDPDLHIQHARNGGEVGFDCADGSRYMVDGYDAKTRTVYEYLGCFWHGCTNCLKTGRCETHSTLGTAPWERFHHTMYRLAVLRQHPDIDHVVTKWECEFQQDQKVNTDLTAFLAPRQGGLTYLPEPLDPREAFFGGRTNATKLFYEAKEEEEIKYVDVCSLYPYICKYGTFPVGHPEIRDHPPVSDLFQLHGLIQCRVLPPSDLYHPVLPYRAHGKLLFPLCRTCADEQLDASCPHSDEDRAWVGTYVSQELQYAVQECGYRVLYIFEAWHFNRLATYDSETHEGGLFAKYVNNFFKIKQEASGYPEGCTDPEAYISDIERKEGVTLDSAHIRKNPGLRALAKACLNNHWGKFGQRLGFGKTEYITSPQRFFALLLDERCDVQDVNIINEDLVCVTYKPKTDYHEPHPASNVVIAAWVTAQARLKLYRYLKPLDRRVLYFDTDSIIYIHRPQCWNPPLGDTLGDLTDEIGEGNSIQTFVSAGPKNYAYKLRQPKEKQTLFCKVRGFTLNHRASQHVNFDSMKNMVCKNKKKNMVCKNKKKNKNKKEEEEDDAPPISVPYPHRILRGGFQQDNAIVSKDTTKTYRLVYTKRRVLYNSKGVPMETLPYGYKE